MHCQGGQGEVRVVWIWWIFRLFTEPAERILSAEEEGAVRWSVKEVRVA